MPALRLKIADLSSIFLSFFFPALPVLFPLFFFSRLFRVPIFIFFFSFLPSSPLPPSFTLSYLFPSRPMFHVLDSAGVAMMVVVILSSFFISYNHYRVGSMIMYGSHINPKEADRLFLVVVVGRSGCGEIQLPVPARFM